ncbi:cupin domain-containing protein [bacterium]|nr:cupin domain-containing protein [bacterium]
MASLELLKGMHAPVQDHAALEKALRARGLSIFNWSDGPGTIYSPHCHSHDEYIIVVEGSIEFTVSGSVYLMEPGDELVLPEGTMHSAYVPGDDPVHYLICS